MISCNKPRPQASDYYAEVSDSRGGIFFTTEDTEDTEKISVSSVVIFYDKSNAIHAQFV